MKKSELRKIIKEEIQKVLNENEFESFLNSLNISVDKSKELDRGIDIGSDVTVIKYGQGTYIRSFISNAADPNQKEEDFKDERWKLSSIADFYLGIGRQMWNMFKENEEYIIHSDEFEDLFLEILNVLRTLQKFDQGMNEDLEDIIRVYEKIGDKIGAGVI